MSTLQSIYAGNYGGSKSKVNNFIGDYENWLGKDLWGVSLHTGDDNWLDWLGSINWLSNIYKEVNDDHQILWSVHLIPETEASMRGAAEGRYNDKYKEGAQRLLEASDASGSDPIYIRTGWEFNFQWAKSTAYAGGREANFVAAYRNFVKSFRDVSDRFKFEWTPNIGTDGSTDIKAAYPGDEYVDIIGMDFYWDAQSSWSITDPVQAWNYMLTQPYGLNWLTDFAEQHGKPVAISEWGLNSDNAAPYIEAAMKWFEENNVLYQNYWESNAVFEGKLSEGQYPVSAEVFKNAFGESVISYSSDNQSVDLPDMIGKPEASEKSEKTYYGSTKTETLSGTNFNDAIAGGGGNDTLVGGRGDDHYRHISGGEIIIEQAGQGIDSVYSWALNNTLSANVEHMYLLGSTYTQNATGNQLDNIISATNGNNSLTGMAGDDWLITGKGYDVINFAKGDGHDVVTDFSVKYDRVSIEGYDFTYQSLFSSLYQQGKDSVLYFDGNNAITFQNTKVKDFSYSNFQFSFASAVNAKPQESEASETWLAGSTKSETITGSHLNDSILGVGGFDTLRGGRGDDHYKHLVGKETIIENAGEGIDSVYSWASTTTLSNNVEHLYLLGDYSQNGIGNALDNIISAKSGDNILRGNKGNDWITTSYGKDEIIYVKGDGHDVITDFSIYNDMITLSGFDLSKQDLLKSISAEGENTVLNIDAEHSITFLNRAPSQIKSYNFNLTNVVNIASGSVEQSDNQSNEITLPKTPSKLSVSSESETWISGTSGADRLIGNKLDDTLASGGGADLLRGGAGDDHYKHLEGRETIIEKKGEGIDSIYSWASSTMLSDNVEHLYLLGDYAQNATGNSLNNIIKTGDGDNIIRGNKGNDWITTGKGEDHIIFVKGDGHDVITDFNTKDDVLLLNGFDVDIIDITDHLYTQNNDVLLYLENGNAVTFQNTKLTNFGFDNFSTDSVDSSSKHSSYNEHANIFDIKSDRFYKGAETVTGFNLSDGDQLDMSDLLEEFDFTQHAIEDFIKLSNKGDANVVSVDKDGLSNSHGFKEVVKIASNDFDSLNDLFNTGAIIV